MDKKRIAMMFATLSNLTRLGIVLALAEEEMNVGQIALRFDIDRQTISNHLTQIRLAGIAFFRREGNRSVYHLTEEGMKLIQFIGQVSA